MCPCPFCATIAILLLPFAGYRWAKKIIKEHHAACKKCQEGEHVSHAQSHTKCSCVKCKTKKGKK